jgi:hypothetical protein
LTIFDEKLGANVMVKSKNFHMNIIVISLVISKELLSLKSGAAQAQCRLVCITGPPNWRGLNIFFIQQ